MRAVTLMAVLLLAWSATAIGDEHDVKNATTAENTSNQSTAKSKESVRPSAGGATEASKEEAEEATRALSTGKQADGAHDYGYTSHFNLDNRDSSTNKYWCQVECILRNGQKRWYPLGGVNVSAGELHEVNIYQKHVHVTKCRFWWKIRRIGPWYHSDWVEADPGYYIVYAFLHWLDPNDYQRPIDFYQEPFSTSGQNAQQDSEDSSEMKASYGQVKMGFAHDYQFNDPVTVYVSGPFGAAPPFQLKKNAIKQLYFQDAVQKRSVAAYRDMTGELVTLEAFVPCNCSKLLNENVCGHEWQETEPSSNAEESSKGY
jgi:hypothetical protein